MKTKTKVSVHSGTYVCVTNKQFLQNILREHTLSTNEVGRGRGKERLVNYSNYVLSERSRGGGVRRLKNCFHT